jgi:hypothetical protein
MDVSLACRLVPDIWKFDNRVFGETNPRPRGPRRTSVLSAVTRVGQEAICPEGETKRMSADRCGWTAGVWAAVGRSGTLLPSAYGSSLLPSMSFVAITPGVPRVRRAGAASCPVPTQVGGRSQEPPATAFSAPPRPLPPAQALQRGSQGRGLRAEHTPRIGISQYSA